MSQNHKIIEKEERLPREYEEQLRREHKEELNRQYQELLAKSPKEIVEEIKEIEKGEKLPGLFDDIPFKKIFDADARKERLNTLLQLIFHFKYQVVSSLKNEPALTTIYSKKSILDILAKLNNGSITNLEMQELNFHH